MIECIEQQVVEAWHLELERYIAVSMLQCVQNSRVFHTTEPEGLRYEVVNDRVQWYIEVTK